MIQIEQSRATRVTATLALAGITLAGLTGCASGAKKETSCYSMPASGNSKEITSIMDANRTKYDSITNRISAAMIAYLGMKQDAIKEFDGWDRTSGNIRGFLYDEHKGTKTHPDIPGEADVIAWMIEQDDESNINAGGHITAIQGATLAFRNTQTRDANINFTGGFAKISCTDATPVEAYN